MTICGHAAHAHTHTHTHTHTETYIHKHTSTHTHTHTRTHTCTHKPGLHTGFGARGGGGGGANRASQSLRGGNTIWEGKCTETGGGGIGNNAVCGIAEVCITARGLWVWSLRKTFAFYALLGSI